MTVDSHSFTAGEQILEEAKLRKSGMVKCQGAGGRTRAERNEGRMLKKMPRHEKRALVYLTCINHHALKTHSGFLDWCWPTFRAQFSSSPSIFTLAGTDLIALQCVGAVKKNLLQFLNTIRPLHVLE